MCSGGDVPRFEHVPYDLLVRQLGSQRQTASRSTQRQRPWNQPSIQACRLDGSFGAHGGVGGVESYEEEGSFLVHPGSLEGGIGGDACESNTPGTLFTPHDGFEDRGAHQDSSISVQWNILAQTAGHAPSRRSSPSRTVKRMRSMYSSSGTRYLRESPSESLIGPSGAEPPAGMARVMRS